MSTSKKPSKSPANYQVQFVQCELDKATKEQVKNWDPKLEATMDIIDRMVVDGYKISVSPDKYHDCVGCFATINDRDHPHFGLCLSARGPNFLQAMKVLAFKHSQVLDGDWGTVVNQKSQGDTWG